jgi:hypothetical protein
MAKRTSKKTTARRKSAKKPGRRKKTVSTKAAAEPRLTKAQKTNALKKLKKIGSRPSHPTKHLGPVLPLDMGPPEKPKRQKKRAKKAAKKKR